MSKELLLFSKLADYKLTSACGIVPLTSKQGNCVDNTEEEKFFSLFKAACFYRHKPNSFKETDERVDRYIHFYNQECVR